MKIILDPRTKFHYFSFYYSGFNNIFSKENIKWDIQPFLGLPLYEKDGSYILIDNKLVFIDYNDPSLVHEDVFDIVNLYAKINVRLDEDRNKIFILGPSFSISVSNAIASVLLGISNYYKIQKSIVPDSQFISYLKPYFFTLIRRKSLKYYCPKTSLNYYIFTMSTLWYDTVTQNNTNRFRGIFIRECKKRFKNNFEGGFYYIDSKVVENEFPPYNDYKEEFKDCITTKRISYSEYLNKINQSSFVFNTPAVGLCHGWKLAEYLSLGKAIISTPLTRKMPVPFKNGTHALIIDNIEEVGDAMDYLISNNTFRLSLEKNAYTYWDQYLTPSKVIQRLIIRLNQ